jgi:hypothetical protein
MNKKKKDEKKTGKRLPGLLSKPVIAGAGAFVLLGAGLFFLLRPKPLWYVEAGLASSWTRSLRDAENPPFNRMELLPEEGQPSKAFGFIITRRGPAGERQGDAPVLLYPGLARTREYNGALVLALDPWMVFRKHQDPGLARDRVEAAGGRAGLLLLPGEDKAAVRAWLSQILQESPGVFPPGQETWAEAERNLLRSRRFQSGASSFAWNDMWIMLFRDNPAWVYAPLSLVRGLPPYRMGLLDAARFPEPSGWNEYGIQAEVLWAIPFGTDKQKQKLAGAADWLRDGKTQTQIANTLGWIPANSGGIPYNTVSRESQLTWLRSSFIWQNTGEGAGQLQTAAAGEGTGQ